MLDPTLLNPIARAIYDTSISAQHSNQFTPTMGTIIDLDTVAWKACVEFVDPLTHNPMLKKDVPLPNIVNGIKPIMPKAGDHVSISFISGDIHAPQITNIYPADGNPLGANAKYGVETSRILGIF